MCSPYSPSTRHEQISQSDEGALWFVNNFANFAPLTFVGGYLHNFSLLFCTVLNDGKIQVDDITSTTFCSSGNTTTVNFDILSKILNKLTESTDY